ncbi:epididymal-specific lipocalin-12 [Talpa occidentalis]|uniref:epididymal-specific lipocalin-12 n=1 Tax=Talpa occidentalis TaxID=50954 RepID=UPI0023F83314|nr:epididymal-specific lipocalin-12 [Talpa occidentalis]
MLAPAAPPASLGPASRRAYVRAPAADPRTALRAGQAEAPAGGAQGPRGPPRSRGQVLGALLAPGCGRHASSLGPDPGGRKARLAPKGPVAPGVREAWAKKRTQVPRPPHGGPPPSRSLPGLVAVSEVLGFVHNWHVFPSPLLLPEAAAGGQGVNSSDQGHLRGQPYLARRRGRPMPLLKLGQCVPRASCEEGGGTELASPRLHLAPGASGLWSSRLPLRGVPHGMLSEPLPGAGSSRQPRKPEVPHWQGGGPCKFQGTWYVLGLGGNTLRREDRSVLRPFTATFERKQDGSLEVVYAMRRPAYHPARVPSRRVGSQTSLAKASLLKPCVVHFNPCCRVAGLWRPPGRSICPLVEKGVQQRWESHGGGQGPPLAAGEALWQGSRGTCSPGGSPSPGAGPRPHFRPRSRWTNSSILSGHTWGQPPHPREAGGPGPNPLPEPSALPNPSHRGQHCVTWSYVLTPEAQTGRFSVNGSRDPEQVQVFHTDYATFAMMFSQRRAGGQSILRAQLLCRRWALGFWPLNNFICLLRRLGLSPDNLVFPGLPALRWRQNICPEQKP